MSLDLIIIGAGPAGMAAALTAGKLGLKTALLDEQPRPGGQIYRNVTQITPETARILGPDYLHGSTLASLLKDAYVDLHFGTTVWDIAPDLTVSAMANGRSFQLRAPQLIAATGAMERASPIPGWTLPGVLNAGAAQIALKSGGPLFLLVARQLLDAGAEISGLVETSSAANRWSAAPYFANALRAPKLLAKGLGMVRRLKHAKVPWFKAAQDLVIEGRDRVEAVAFTSSGRQHRLAADVVLVHHGVVPNTQISRLLRVEHDWDEAQLAWQPRLDPFGETSVAGFRIAGDGGGIAGALAAEAGGEIAAIGVAHALGRISAAERDRMIRRPRRKRRAQLRIRPFLDALYRPPAWIVAPSGDTIVCRCEEVTARDIEAMARLGCLGPNQTKFFSRCGMGPCQGRICGLGVTNILARELGSSPEAVGAYRIRAPLKPVPLGAIRAIDAEKQLEATR